MFAVPFGTAPTILTLVTWRLSLNCGGGAKTASVVSLLLPQPSNSGGGGRQNSSFSSFSFSIGGGSWASETAWRDSRPGRNAKIAIYTRIGC